MRFLFTGTSGTGIRAGLEKLANYRQYFGHCPRPRVLSVEDYMVKIGREKGMIAESGLYVGQKTSLEALWGQAHEHVACDADGAEREGRDVFIHFHACWYLQAFEEFTTPVWPQKLVVHQAQSLVAVIDDVSDVRRRLLQDGRLLVNVLDSEASDEELFAQEIRQLRLCLRWRDREIMVSDLVGRAAGVSRRYLLAAKHPLSTFHRLLYEPNGPRIYLSHPISQPRRLLAKGDPAGRAEFDELAKSIERCTASMSREAVVFTPTSIDELRLAYGDEVVTCADRWPVRESEQSLFWSSPRRGHEGIYDGVIRKSDRELRALFTALCEEVGEQVNSRDHTLVEQSDGLAVWRPLYQGNRSTGVFEEAEHLQRLSRVPASTYRGLAVYTLSSELQSYPQYELKQLLLFWHDEGALTAAPSVLETVTRSSTIAQIFEEIAPLDDGTRFEALRNCLIPHGVDFRAPSSYTKRTGSPLVGRSEGLLLQEWIRAEGERRLSRVIVSRPYFETYADDYERGEGGKLVVTVFQEPDDPESFGERAIAVIRDAINRRG